MCVLPEGKPDGAFCFFTQLRLSKVLRGCPGKKLLSGAILLTGLSSSRFSSRCFAGRTTKRRALLLDLVLRNEGRTILPLASEALQFSFLSSKEPKRRPCCRTRETLHRYTQVFERRSEIPLYFLVHNAFCNDCMPDRRRSTCGSSIDDASPPLAVIIVIAVRGTTAR